MELKSFSETISTGENAAQSSPIPTIFQAGGLASQVMEQLGVGLARAKWLIVYRNAGRARGGSGLSEQAWDVLGSILGRTTTGIDPSLRGIWRNTNVIADVMNQMRVDRTTAVRLLKQLETGSKLLPGFRAARLQKIISARIGPATAGAARR